MSEIKEPIVYNLNWDVKVKITDTGWAILKKFYAELNHEVPDYLKEDEMGYTKFQLWDLMSIFGPHLVMGFDAPIDTDIILLGDPWTIWKES